MFGPASEVSDVFSENTDPYRQDGKKARICKVCGKEGDRSAIIHHIEANHIAGISIPCDLCGQVVGTRHALAQHKSKHHRNHWVWCCLFIDLLKYFKKFQNETFRTAKRKEKKLSKTHINQRIYEYLCERVIVKLYAKIWLLTRAKIKI